MGRQRRNIHINDYILEIAKNYNQSKLVVEYANKMGIKDISYFVEDENFCAIALADKILELLNITEPLLASSKKYVDDNIEKEQ